MASSPELSVVIPTFNAAKTIGAQLDALLSQSWDGDWEIIIADNGSTDDTLSVVDTYIDRDIPITRLDAGARRGPSFARNFGVASAQGSSLAFCDADDVVGDKWVATMGAALRKTSLISGPQEQRLLNPVWLQNIHGTAMSTERQSFAGVFPFAPSSNLGIRRDAFERVGGFDEALRVGEDLDLCLRLWLEGTELDFSLDAIVHYRHRSAIADIWMQSLSYGAASVAIFSRLSRAGCPTPSRWRGGKNWLWLVRRLPLVRTRVGRARWVAVAGGVAGRLLGSFRERSVFL